MCNTSHPSTGIATGDNGKEYLVCKYCDIDGSKYNGWGDLDEPESESESESESDSESDSDELACCFCENILIYGGNNAYPLNNKKCCDDCNETKVIPALFKEFMESHSDLEDLLG